MTETDFGSIRKKTVKEGKNKWHSYLENVKFIIKAANMRFPLFQIWQLKIVWNYPQSLNQ